MVKITASILGSCLFLLMNAAVAVEFETDVVPVLEARCYKCHGEEKQKSKLRLDSAEAILKGGESGEPVFVAGQSAGSHIIKLVTGEDPDEVMPPKGERLTADEVSVLRTWIDEGAKLPGIAANLVGKLSTDHWSFQPVVRPELPIEGDPFIANPVDSFVLAKMRAAALLPSRPADRHTLIRRLYLVMHGMPPTPDEVDAFVRDKSKDAYRKLVDRVLKSPRYGERWGRHWLDVARYADTNGFETNRERKTAYHYRDYVINAFNDDKPYDRFIVEQLAGDTCGADAATGFLVAGPYDIVKSPDINLTLMQRQDELADMVNTTGTAFLGLTLGCARCHNHKFDPILQKDYYSIQAVFAGVNYAERRLPKALDEATAKRLPKLKLQQKAVDGELLALKLKSEIVQKQREAKEELSLRPPVNASKNTDEFSPTDAKVVRFTIHASSGSQPCIDELEIFDTKGENVALASKGAVPTASGTLPGYAIHKLKHINDGKYGNPRSWISNTTGGGWIQIELKELERIERIEWARDRIGGLTDRLATDYVIEASTDGAEWHELANSHDRKPYGGSPGPTAYQKYLVKKDAARAKVLETQTKTLTQQIADLENGPSAWVGTFGQPGPTHRLYRGEPMQKREVVAPDALTVLGTLAMAVDEPEQERRRKLADWIASKENPLPARVLVNRLWHYVFGIGIVETPSDLGVNGVPPTHPELLDWLAHEFMHSGWSVKHMQRLILLSNTFQQASTPRPDASKIDASSRLLWRFPPRRLEAEAIRDSILAVSGALDLTQGGPGFYLHRVQVENVMHYFPKDEFGPEDFRRMVYLFKIRQEQDAIFGSFDCPDGNQAIAKRSRSNTPLQALNLFNSPFVLQQAEYLSNRLTDQTSSAGKVTKAFQLVLARDPDAFEIEASTEIIEAEGLQAFCRALLNTSEFLFVF
jgi:hypothetical protein